GVAAWGFIRFLALRSAVEIPLLQSVRLDAWSFGFTVLLCLIAVVLCGAMPAWRLAENDDLQHSLKDDARGAAGGRQRTRTRGTLVVLEVALACVLTLSAGLMVRSFFNLLKVDLGFEPRDLIAMRIDPMIEGSHANYLESVLERVRALPGVEHAAVTDCVPVERDRTWGLYPVIQDHPNDQRWTGAHVRIVSPGSFTAMGTRLIAGRDFTHMDTGDAPPVIIINESLAKLFWPGENPLGRQVSGGNKVRTVIGVVADVRHSGPELPSGNEMYFSFRDVGSNSWDMLVRTKLPVSTLTADLRNALRDVDATLPLTKVRTLQSLVDRTLSSRRLLVWLIGGFAAIAVGLAALGLYGLISYTVTQQTKEIGIRMALGADASTVQWHVVGQTMKLAGLGLALGLGVAFAAGRWLQSLLYGVSANDAVNALVTATTLIGCALIAGYLPARRASRVDPLVALRAD
ncbi:MAG TPA: FtsX-like permease family protein, partial [Opitutus sp.]|nr:FtsX-like permease family protein [Opitutus sp.]